MDLFADKKLSARANINWKPGLLPNLRGEKTIVIDTETTGLKWWDGHLPIGLSISLIDDEEGTSSQYIPWGHRGGGNLPEAATKRWVIDNLRGKNIVGHNMKFDNHMLNAWGVDLEALGCRLYDTQHLAALLDDHRRDFHLDFLAKELLGGRGKEEFTSYTKEKIIPSRMADYHAGEIAFYAEVDADITKQLWNLMRPQTTDEGLDKVVDLESRLIYPVAYMERHPPQLDVEKLAIWIKESEADLHFLIKQICEATGFQNFNPDSSKNWRALFEKLNVGFPEDRTEKGQVSFSDSSLKKVKNPIVQLGRKAKLLHSLRSKYLLAYVNGMSMDGRLRTNFHQLRADEGGTVSGRFSSSAFRIPASDEIPMEKVGANLQQVYAVEKQREKFGNDKYIIRELFLPDEGIWFSADAAQIEYRIFAHYSDSEKILAAYAKDPETDYHQIVMDMLLPFKPGLTRKPVKNLNFAKIYGAGRDKVAEMLELPRSESDPFVRLYDNQFPEALELLNLASNVARIRGYVKTFLGRRSRFPKAQRLHKALNAIIQGGAAEIMKEEAIVAYENRKELGLTLRMTVHDELDGDIPDKEMARRLQDLLNVQRFDLKVPILWSMKTGRNWGECA